MLTLVIILKLLSSTKFTGDLLLQKNTGAYQHPQMELYNYNTGAYGGAIKFTGNLAGTKYTQATIEHMVVVILVMVH